MHHPMPGRRIPTHRSIAGSIAVSNAGSAYGVALGLAAILLAPGCGERGQPLASAFPATGPEPRLRLEVDGSDLPRGLLHARETIPVEPGTAWLWFPKWIPGTHAPCGPVENLGGLRAFLPSGERLAWRRDEVEPNRFGVSVPPDARSIVVAIDYICNQPSVNSKGVDTFGAAGLAVIGWNTCLLYPEGWDEDRIHVDARLRLPEGWRAACALPRLAAESQSGAPTEARAEGGPTLTFAETTLRELIDAPVVASPHLRSHDLSTVAPDATPAAAGADDGARLRLVLDVAADRDELALLPPAGLAGLARLAEEAHAQFPGRTPFGVYHLLAVAGDDLDGIGLEHQSCSLNGFQPDVFAGMAADPSRVGAQLAHEFCHAWCGKYRRPAGMYTHDFHTPERTALLWVYEGLDMYLGEVLASRAGLEGDEGFPARLQAHAQELALHAGRDWRTLEDTAIVNWQLRGPSAHWGHLRRDQDYYIEGMLLWLEIDGIIRGESGGSRSLDDVCKVFFKVEGDAPVRPYGTDDVIAALQSVQPHDWRALLDERVLRTSAELSFAGLERCGWRVRMAPERQEPQRTYAASYQYLDESWSLGLTALRGVIKDVVPGSPADRARLAPGMRILRIGGRAMSASSLDRALADAVGTGTVALRLGIGPLTRDVELAYAGGPRYFAFERIEGAPDVLAAIVVPRSAAGLAFAAARRAPPAPEADAPDAPAEAERPSEPVPASASPAQAPAPADPAPAPAATPPEPAVSPAP